MTERLFNSIFENSLRLVILIDVIQEAVNFDMLYCLDFMTSYSMTFGVGDEDLNGDNPYKYSELVEVTGTTMENVRTGFYNIKKLEYSDLILSLMEIDKRHQIIKNQERETQNLTNRTFLHSYFLNEEVIYQSKVAFDVPGYPSITSVLTSLHFLFTGNDLHELVPQVPEKGRKLNEAKRDAVIYYIGEKIEDLKVRREEVEKELAEYEDIDVDRKIEETLVVIADLEKQISEVTEASRKIVLEICDLSAKLEEANFLSNRYKALQTQYQSDMKRLRFIIDGEEQEEKRQLKEKCPFCESDISRKSVHRISYKMAAEIELSRIGMQLQDLKEAEKDITDEAATIETELSELEERNAILTERISQSLKPQARKMQELLQSYRRTISLKETLFSIQEMASSLNTDAYEKEQQEETKVPEIRAIECFDADKWDAWSSNFEKIVKACAYPRCMTAWLSKVTYDAVVDGKHKAEEGKGYRAFLNSIILFSLMKTLEEGSAYRLPMLILDFPILTLKERKKIMLDELAPPDMRESLFQYFVDHCGDNQMIIIENGIPGNVNYGNANLIEFT